jgi:hypothetical protein
MCRAEFNTDRDAALAQAKAVLTKEALVRQNAPTT